jgi:hypothetical protein
MKSLVGDPLQIRCGVAQGADARRRCPAQIDVGPDLSLAGKYPVRCRFGKHYWSTTCATKASRSSVLYTVFVAGPAAFLFHFTSLISESQISRAVSPSV